MISTKGRYAIRLMIDLAEQPQDTAVPLNDIAKRQGISKKYLESVVKLLVQGKLVKGASGKGGHECAGAGGSLRGRKFPRLGRFATVECSAKLGSGAAAQSACADHFYRDFAAVHRRLRYCTESAA